MAPAADDGATSGGRRRGRRSLSWGTVFCFGSRSDRDQEEGTTPWERSRSRPRWRKRTVPVDEDDGEPFGTAAADSVAMWRGTGEESRKGSRLPGCCFLAPPRAPARKHNAMDSSGGHSKQRHLERTEQQPPPPRSSQSHKNSSPYEAPPQIQATGGSNGSRSRGAELPRGAPAKTRAADKACERAKSRKSRDGVGSFGPVVGLSVVVAVSMAGLLGGRLWAVACVCAWLAALSRLRRRESTAAGGGGAKEVAVDVVDSIDHRKLVVLRGLLDRGRAKGVPA